MGQDIFNTDGSSTGNLVQGRTIIKTVGKFDTQGIQTGFNNEPQGTGVAISSLTGLYRNRYDDENYY